MKHEQSNLAIRLLLTASIYALYFWVSNILTTNKSLALGDAAAHQFDPHGAASALLAMQTNNQLFDTASTVLWFATSASIFFIWLKPLRYFVRAVFLAVFAFAISSAIFLPNQAMAYYSINSNDAKETQDIQANETGFLVNMKSGATDGQSKLDSATFKDLKKVSTQRVEIPHEQVINPGWLIVPNYWVSIVRLLKVNRQPVSREWVTSETRGTSSKDEGFRFETAQSHDGRTGIVVSAFIREEDAALYLYWYGPKPINQDDPQQRYASVVYAESLAEVVDMNVRRKVQEVLAREFGKLATDEAITKKAEVMAIVKKEVVDDFAKQGITITTLGYAEGITWGNPAIQKAMDDVYIAGKSALIAKAQAETLPVQMEMANIEMRHAQARAIEILAQRWGGTLPALPNWVATPESFSATAATLFRSLSGPSEVKPVSTIGK